MRGGGGGSGKSGGRGEGSSSATALVMPAEVAKQSRTPTQRQSRESSLRKNDFWNTKVCTRFSDLYIVEWEKL